MAVNPKALEELLERYKFDNLKEYPNVGINKKGEVEEFSYSGNFQLRHRNAKLLFTKKAQEEYDKCAQDFFYFAKNWVFIETIDYGITNFNLREWQVETIEALQKYKKIVLNVARQSGKSTIIVAYILWLFVFNKDMKLGIVANRTELTSELMNMLKSMYSLLPPFLQHSVLKWNTRSIELTNGCKVVSAVASPSALRGQTISFLLCTEGSTEVEVYDTKDGQFKIISMENLYDILDENFELERHD